MSSYFFKASFIKNIIVWHCCRMFHYYIDRHIGCKSAPEDIKSFAKEDPAKAVADAHDTDEVGGWSRI